MIRTVAYQGTPGAFSHQASCKIFPKSRKVHADTFVGAIELVEAGKADVAVIPVENSTAGRVEEIYRIIPSSNIKIIGEHFEPISHCLLANAGSQLEDISEVRSHPQALAQCSNKIKELDLNPSASFNTAGAAKALSLTPEKHAAVIASAFAAQLYNLQVLMTDFENIQGNTTRFLILSKEARSLLKNANEHYVTSIYFTTKNIPAALYKALGGFATSGINMLKIESYIDPKTMERSSFHLDIDGGLHDKKLIEAMDELSFYAKSIKILGSYPAHHFRQTSNQSK